jgi:hypothetical protein
MKSMLMSAVSAACLLLGAGAAWADGPVTVMAKAGGSFDQRAADQDRCSAVVQRAPLADLPPPEHPIAMPVVTGGGAGGMAGALVVATIIESEELARARDAGEKVCMRNLGYFAVPLTADEAAQYGKGSHETFERSFLAGDMSARIKAMNANAVPLLPGYASEPMVYGGLKIDPASIALSAPDNDGAGVILTAKATRVHTATLVTPIATTDGKVRIAADPGAVFHQVDHRYQHAPILRAQTATWCGPVHQVGTGAADFYCFTARDDGYEIYQPSGESWYAGPYTDGLMLPRYTKPIQIQERASDDLGPLDVTLEVRDVHEHYMDLAAYVTKDGGKSEIWSGRCNFNSSRQTTLALWNQRLQLTRAEHGSHLKLSLQPNSDGQNWRAEDMGLDAQLAAQ